MIDDQQQISDVVHEALQHWGAGYGLALQYTGDRGRAEDLCQEAFLKLCELRRPLDPSRSLRGYLLAIVRNLAANDSRKASTRPGGQGFDTNDAADPAPGPASELVMREEIAHVRRMVEDLSPAWRVVLYLRDGLGLGAREVGNVLDMTEETVRVTLHRARTRLRERVTQQANGGSVR